MKKFFEQKKSALISGMNSNKGFSLVELIIVVAIMAVLMGVLAPQYLRFVESSREQSDATTAKSIVSAMTTALATSEGIATDGSMKIYYDANGVGYGAVASSTTTSTAPTVDFYKQVWMTLGETVSGTSSTWASAHSPMFSVGLGATGTPIVTVDYEDYTTADHMYSDRTAWEVALQITHDDDATYTPSTS